MDDKSPVVAAPWVYCPFYISEQERTITCEGVFGTKTRNTFNSRNAKRIHQIAHCNCEGCKKCGIYQLIMKKYESREE